MSRLFSVLGLLALGLTACGPVAPPSGTASAPSGGMDVPGADRGSRSVPGNPSPGIEAPPAPPEAAAPTRGPVEPPRRIRVTRRGIAIDGVVFDARSHHLIVADQPDGPGSRWPDARAAAAAFDGLAAVNGGFFTPEGDPLGLVIHDGRRVGSINRASSLGSGFVLESPQGELRLTRRAAFSGARHALQAGPFLVEGGGVVDGLGEQTASARTFVATDGRERWVIARTGPCSLRQLAAALAGEPLGGLRLDRALNLDGGRSSEIWIGDGIAGGPVRTRPFWNKPVRNFLILRKRR